MLSFNPNKENCTGCTACLAICPVHCISMQYDQEGFLYPIASDACINCGLCRKVCPQINYKEKSYESPQVFILKSKSYSIWEKSTSGGAFTEICRVWGGNDVVIAGAAWDGFRVHHICVQGISNIHPLRKSKYIESAMENIYCEVKAHLNNGKKVIFSGTPCQVAGLHSFLQESYNNLLTIDLICHGVGSPNVFFDCIKRLENKYHKEIISYQFRAKRLWFEHPYISMIRLKHGGKRYIQDDEYMQLYLSQVCHRYSCDSNCKYRSANRPSDITIADYKGISNIFSSRYRRFNYSTICINTTKFYPFVNQLQQHSDVISYSVKDVINDNPWFACQGEKNGLKEDFYSIYKCDASIAIETYAKQECREMHSIIYTLVHKGIKKIKKMLYI